jgi:hypothetical protein
MTMKKLIFSLTVIALFAFPRLSPIRQASKVDDAGREQCLERER